MFKVSWLQSVLSVSIGSLFGVLIGSSLGVTGVELSPADMS